MSTYAEQGMIEKIEFEYPDVQLVFLKNGEVLGISSDCVCLYPNVEAFYECASNEIPTITLGSKQ